MPKRVWTSREAEKIHDLLQSELDLADGEAARLLRARCDWLITEFTRADDSFDACTRGRFQHKTLQVQL